MELDLNQEPLDQIEERIRRLEGVVFRARQRQRWRRGHTPIHMTNFSGELTTTAAVQDGGMVHEQDVGIAVEGGTVESGKGGKRKTSYLVAKALGMETYDNELEGCTGNFFDCNICLDMARDPVLTCCGHLFCWPCFYQLSYAYLNAKECPVCKGEVTETGIIPIYGSSSVSSSCQLELKETGLRVPARPRAPRIEGIRQHLRNRGASSTIQDMLQFGNFFGGLGERVQLEIPTTATNNNQHTSSHQFSRLLVQGASSFSALSSAINSAMDSAERLFQELESYIDNHPIGSIRQLSPHAVDRDSLFGIAAVNQSAATNSAATTSVSPLSRNDDINAVTDSNIQTTDSSIQFISSDPSSSSRTDVSR